jgi:hypothetical protein
MVRRAFLLDKDREEVHRGVSSHNSNSHSIVENYMGNAFSKSGQNVFVKGLSQYSSHKR